MSTRTIILCLEVRKILNDVFSVFNPYSTLLVASHCALRTKDGLHTLAQKGWDRGR